ncbi:MAG: phosphoribosyltransferase [Candidatus Verstraetearchaeota archaeon]|nr:phosphoribosyltransferase [Candidatus Verstraetearchaeota archaeon]
MIKPRVCEYNNQEYHIVKFKNITRKLPIVSIGNGIWIASDAELVLGDVEFISKISEEIAKLIKPFNPEVIVTPESKSIALAYEISKNLNIKKFVVARKSIKAYMKECLVEKVKSITTKGEQILVLTNDDAMFIKNRKVCIFDDVVSTGGTITSLEKLIKKAEGIIVCKACIWLEGPWYNDSELIFLDILPIYVSKEKLSDFVNI